RLTHTSDIGAVQRTGRRRRSPRLDIYWCGNELGHSRFGVVVARHGQSAVARNRLRRRLREILRRRIVPSQLSLDLVVRTRAAAYRARFHELAADVDIWMRSLTD
ncbi:MAG: ribonuclease P protein component, partial [Gemmatimonadales bacterium]